MFPLPVAWTYEAGLPQEEGILGFPDNAVLVICGIGTDTGLFLHTLVRVQGTSTSLKVLHRRLPLHRQAREARVWAEAEERAYRPRHQKFRGVSTPSHHWLTQRINQLYRVRFCYLAYGQGYYLILVHHIHSSLHQL